jgi:hypothetical protein
MGMSNCLFATLVIAVGLIGSADAQRSRYPIVDESTITRTLAFAGGSGRLLDVRNLNGFLHVTAGGGPNVEISIHKTIRARSDADKAEAERDVRLDFVERAPRVEAIVRDRRNHVCGEDTRDDRGWDRVYYDVRFDFTIRVPRDVQLRLCTINAGDLTVDGTRGDFDVDNVNGRIDMTEVAGSGHAHTVNGGVKVSFTANPNAASSFKTVNGNVDVYFQDGLSADLRMKTMNGGLFTDFDAQPLPSLAATSGEHRNGRFVYRANEFTRVRVGRGGPEITFETLNGSVRAIRARR